MLPKLKPPPRLGAETDFPFPDVSGATAEGIVCWGGNLSPGVLVSAYRRGIFPWYAEGEPILWWSPEPRFVVLPETFHIPARAARSLRKDRFGLTLDRDFSGVIRACAASPRKDQDGTWLLPEMIEAYIELHRLGYAHSIEVWEEGELSGGLYGVSLGSAFFGESMFSHSSGASRYGFLRFASRLFAEGFELIDSQVHTDYLASMGGVLIPRGEYLRRLKSALTKADRKGFWHSRFPGFETELHGPESPDA